MTSFDRIRQLLDFFRPSSTAAEKARRQQAAAIILRDGPAGGDLLMITSDHGRWIVPKGWIESGEDGASAAIREAFEEAGIRVSGCEGPVCRYEYIKRRPRKGDLDCSADAYLVTEFTEESDWPEREMRERRWVPLPEALRMIDEDGLRNAVTVARMRKNAA